jgi:hypothetical protein
MAAKKAQRIKLQILELPCPEYAMLEKILEKNPIIQGDPVPKETPSDKITHWATVALDNIARLCYELKEAYNHKKESRGH